MNCKDCIHVKVCGEYVAGLAAARGVIIDNQAELEEILECDDCEHFKDSSRLKELPCKVGDTVYYFNHVGTIHSQRVSGFIVNSVGILIDSDVMFDSNLIGNKFFLTREETERTLKERENNA